MEETVLPQQESQSAKIDQPSALEKACNYVDNNWTPSSVLVSGFKALQIQTL